MRVLLGVGLLGMGIGGLWSIHRLWGWRALLWLGIPAIAIGWIIGGEILKRI